MENEWNWQKKEWPEFRYNQGSLSPLEGDFLHSAGIFTGTIKHTREDDKLWLTVELISNEALKTSEIEGEMLNRASLQSSIRRNFGLSTDHVQASPAERGIAELMVDLYRHFDRPLDHRTLFRWHGLLMSGRSDLEDIGRYRTGTDPMQGVLPASLPESLHLIC